MKFLLVSLLYAVMWVLIYFILRFSKSKYFATAIQRNNFLTVLHCFFVPVLTCLYFFSLKSPFGYEYLVDDTLRHLFGVSVGYYLVSLINDIRLFEKVDKANIFHHILTMLGFLFVMNRPEYPAYFAWILLFQATGVFYHTYVILKETEGINKKRIAFWYSANFYAWIFFRFCLEGIYLIGAIYHEITQGALSLNLRIITFIFISISFYFNLHWLFILINKRKGKSNKNQSQLSSQQ